jgi:hypothetical protein
LYRTDIVEAPARHVHQVGPTAAPRPLRYATMGLGLDVRRLVWTEATHVFSSQGTDCSSLLPGCPPTRELGPPHRLPTNQFAQTALDVLLVDMDDSEAWERCLVPTLGTVAAPKAIVHCMSPAFLVDDQKDTVLHQRGKRMKRRGYGVVYWFLQAHHFGAALHQDRLVVVYYQSGYGEMAPRWPESDRLPPRSMANLLSPTGIPPQAYLGGAAVPEPPISPYDGPCKVIGRWGREPVFTPQGLMPDNLVAILEVRGRCRRLQVDELARAKGNPSEWNCKPARRLPKEPVARCTSLHLLAAVGDSVTGNVIEAGAGTPVKGKSPRSPASDAAVGTDQSFDPSEDEFIAWTLPNLEKGGQWYCDRLRSLTAAVKGRPDAEQLMLEGEAALDLHRENYTESGPKRLQLLWWEFPPEHWEALRLGSSMNFLVQPNGQLEFNSEMDDQQLEVASQFVDELVRLGVLVEATQPILANGPLFLVPKPGQPGEWRCISDMKRGGANACMGKDPTYLPRAPDILPRLYSGGYSAVADASKHFYNFPTKADERQYLGCVHPRTHQLLWYAGLPMGSANSPAIACRLGNSGLRLLRTESKLFQGTPCENTWRQSFTGAAYRTKFGHGRVLIGDDGLPAALIFAHVDDYFIHGPTCRKTCLAFNEFMDLSVRIGIICQEQKTHPPDQQQKFCGFLYDTTGMPRLIIPEDKVTKALALIHFLRAGAESRRLARLTLAIVIGRLQALVDATPQRIGNSYLRCLYDELHALEARRDDGRLDYYTVKTLSSTAWQNLEWWEAYLTRNPGATGVSGQSGTLVTTWGDGSGTGAGGTLEIRDDTSPPSMLTWMGTWSPSVQSFSSNWRELRTLYQTLRRQKDNPSLRHSTVFYFTDNLVSYYIMSSGSSTSPELHRLVLQIKRLELVMLCHLEVIHVPGKLMIHQGTDGLSRGLWMTPERTRWSSLKESSVALGPVPFCWQLARWVETTIGILPGSFTQHFGTLDLWSFAQLQDRWSIWTPTPEVARQAISFFLDCWVERLLSTGAAFLVPRILQRTWSHVSHAVIEYKAILPHQLPADCSYLSDIPFVLLVVLPHVRSLPPVLDETSPMRAPFWIRQQIENLHGL